MQIAELLAPDAVLSGLRATSKKQVLQELASRASKISGIQERTIFDTLLERERLGTTGVGNGVAIPHGKLSEISKLHGVFAKLENPINFDSIDEKPVDLVFLILAPEGAGADHLKALAKVSRMLRDENVCEKLRGSENSEALYALFAEDGS